MSLFYIFFPDYFMRESKKIYKTFQFSLRFPAKSRHPNKAVREEDQKEVGREEIFTRWNIGRMLGLIL